jgi:hypothetical protein
MLHQREPAKREWAWLHSSCALRVHNSTMCKRRIGYGEAALAQASLSACKPHQGLTVTNTHPKNFFRLRQSDSLVVRRVQLTARQKLELRYLVLGSSLSCPDGPSAQRLLPFWSSSCSLASAGQTCNGH